jgi:TolB-like protein/tetratricopeptide (TPR) repeat protein
MLRQVVRFSGFEMDLRTRELKRNGVPVRLQDQPFQILAMLLERPGEVVTRDEIRERLWPAGTFVDFEHSVNAAVKRLRAALGDSVESARFIETRHRRGYRFVGELDDPAPRGASAGQRPGLSAQRDRPRLVVLPFVNLGGPDGQDYFSDGLTEELIAQVGRRCAGRIGVLGRTSSMLYKNAVHGGGESDPCLRVEYRVEGSVRRDGERVRITTQVVETQGDTQLWAESFDRPVRDCLTVQAEVAAQIAHALVLELLPAPEFDAAGTSLPAAYQAFLQGRFHWNKPGESGLPQAIEYYGRALDLDPLFGRAYSARARARVSLCEYYMVEPHRVLDLARADAVRALELDATDADAYIALGEVRRMLDWDWTGAEAAYRAALAANPNSEGANRYYGAFLAARGRFDAVTMVDRACDLDPLCLVINTAAATARYFAGDHDAAIERCRYTLEMDPAFGPARRRMAASLAARGQYGEALDEYGLIKPSRLDPVSRAWMGHTLSASGNRAAARAVLTSLEQAVDDCHVPPFHLAMVYAGLGEHDAAVRELGRALGQHAADLDTLLVEPRFAPLGSAPGFVAIAERLGLERPTVTRAS